jgi:nucleotide-binding universal stress UspA family protein
MKTQFDNILVPVDFTFKTEKVIKKAIELANPEGSIMHLVHVVRPDFPFRRQQMVHSLNTEVLGIDSELFVKIMLKFSHWKNMIEESNRGIIVKIHMCKSKKAQLVVEKFAKQLRAQLIVLATNTGKSKFLIGNNISPSQLARKTDCKVLNLHNGILSVYAKENLAGHITYSQEAAIKQRERIIVSSIFGYDRDLFSSN